MGAICRFLVNSASKFLQNTSNIQNISVTLSVVSSLYMFCKLLIYNYKLQNNSEITNLFRALFYPELAYRMGKEEGGMCMR